MLPSHPSTTDVLYSYASPYVDTTAYTWYWFSWDNFTITLGRGNVVGWGDVVFSYYDAQHVGVHSVQFGSFRTNCETVYIAPTESYVPGSFGLGLLTAFI